MVGDDVFELDMDKKVVNGPKTEGLKLSACTPIWFLVYKHRPSAKCVVHTHSMNSQLATLLDPTEESKTLKITHLEMLKGVGGHAFDDVLEIPILDNRPSEDMLAPQMEAALKKYPRCNCVLVRRHGLFVWGDSWEQAKTQAESFDYVFETAIGMRRLGVDFSAIPSRGTFRTDFDEYHKSGKSQGETATTITNNKNKREADNEDEEPPAKRAKASSTSTSSPGWNASGDIDNQADLLSNKTPLLPRDYKYLLLDIEGCTTAISFVKDVLFPYVIEHAEDYIAKNLDADEQEELSKALKADLKPEQIQEVGDDSSSPAAIVKYMVQNDLKVASLKSLQGKMWKDGYKNGTLKGHIYEDFVPMLEWMDRRGVKVYIYSSGSVQAQKLLFGNSIEGDLTKHFAGHFDITTSGNKKQSSSYTNISKDLGVPPSDIVFCSDAVAELEAAEEAGIGKCVMTIRPGNAPLSKEASEKHPQIFSLLQLCGSGL
jgi:methylthioribulose 1-phosphate dehydratase/enolase-phosphatase E1